MTNITEYLCILCVKVNYPCTGCGTACGLLTDANGTLSDGSGPANYSANATCEWMIVSTNKSMVKLQFSEFSTQPGNDVVRVFQCEDASCLQQQQLSELSGTYLSAQDVVSLTGYMKVVFTSDSTISHSGFTAMWSLVIPVYE